MTGTALLNLIAIFIIFGVGLWIINAYIPMPPPIKSLLNLVVVIILVIYVLQFFGLINTVLPMFYVLR